MQPEQPQPTPVSTPPEQPPMPPETPGKTLGIVGFIFAFVGLSVIGLILSIISVSKARKAGQNNYLAVVGIVVNILFTIVWSFMILFTVVAYVGITDKANAHVNTSRAAIAAHTVRLASDQYYNDHTSYPTTVSALGTIPNVTIAAQPLESTPSLPSVVNFYSCGTDGSKVAYWDYASSKVIYEYAGFATSSSSCTIVSN